MSFDKEEEFFNYIGIVLNNEKRTIITKPEFLKIFTKFFENRENKNEWVLNYKSFTFIGWKNSFKSIIFHNPITKEEIRLDLDENGNIAYFADLNKTLKMFEILEKLD